MPVPPALVCLSAARDCFRIPEQDWKARSVWYRHVLSPLSKKVWLLNSTLPGHFRGLMTLCWRILVV